mgnify:CR=1 FL=1
MDKKCVTGLDVARLFGMEKIYEEVKKNEIIEEGFRKMEDDFTNGVVEVFDCYCEDVENMIEEYVK